MEFSDLPHNATVSPDGDLLRDCLRMGLLVGVNAGCNDIFHCHFGPDCVLCQSAKRQGD